MNAQKIFPEYSPPRAPRLSSKGRDGVSRVFSATVAAAIRELRSRAGEEISAQLTSTAERDLSVDLIERLNFALGPVLDLVRRPDLRTANFSLKNLSLSQVLASFRGASETLEMIVADWVEAQHELLSRLHRDRRLLETTFFCEELDLFVQHLYPGLSDPHDRGRTVTLITFRAGQFVIYKPRSCAGEILWFGLLKSINQQGFRPSFFIPKLIDRTRYCWMQFVGSRSCRLYDEIRRFYFRWGAQVRLAEVLRLRDLHRENWVARGSQPVLVDAEIIGDFRALDRNRSEARSFYDLLRSGLFPVFQADRLGVYEGGAPFDSRLRRHESVNWLPRLKHRLVLPQNHTREIVAGYRAMAKHSFEKIQIRPRQMRARTDHCQGRVLIRATAEYYQMLNLSLQPIHMLTTGGRLKYLIRRCRAQGRNQKRAATEANELVRCSIPRFTAPLMTKAPAWNKLTAAQLRLRENLFFRGRRPDLIRTLKEV